MPLLDHIEEQFQSFIAVQKLSEHQSVFRMSHGPLEYQLHTALVRLGLHEICYSLHSFRHGVGVRAFMNGVSSHALMMQGRWASEVRFKRYLQTKISLFIKADMSAEDKRKVEIWAKRW